MVTAREQESVPVLPAVHAAAIAVSAALCVTSLTVAVKLASNAAEKRAGTQDGVVDTRAGLSKACSSSLVRMLPWLHPLTDLQLQGLGLRDEDLRGVALDALRGLTRMNMAKNQLETFPSAVLRLHRLTELDFSHNKMAAVPQGIGKLRRLRRLNLMCNKLSGAVPESLGRLTQLEVLGLRTNSLTALPTTIGCCVSLVELYVTENNLKALPASLGQCKRLRKLQASFNDLTTLPVEMAGCESLELCRLAANPSLSEVPSEITSLPLLAWLSLAGSLWSPGLGMWGEGSLENLKRTDLRFGKKLGEGASGSVFTSTLNGQDVAVKLWNGELSPDGRAVDELEIGCMCDHANITKILGVVGGARPCAVMKLVPPEYRPLADRPNSTSVLRCRWADGAQFTPEAVMRAGAGIARAMEYLHALGIAHGDLYAHNVLADAHGNAVLCDFGSSFLYTPEPGYHFEAIEVRAFGLLMADLARRGGPAVAWIAQDLAAQCSATKPSDRPSFAELGNQLEAELMQELQAEPAVKASRRMSSLWRVAS